MGALYLRRCRVTISLPVSTPGDFQGTTFDQIAINGGDEPTAPGLRVAFKIAKTDKKEPNTSEITVTNLAPSTRGRLQAKGVKVLLEAGYAGTGLSRLFFGDARTIDHVRDGADWNSVIKCGDGERAVRYARLSESFAGGTTAGQILQVLAGAMGLATGNVAAQAGALSTRFDHGYAVSGSVSQAIDRLVTSIGYTWSIQDGALQVLAPDQALDLPIPEVDPEHGLIGSPEMGTPETKGKPALLKFRSLLIPTKPGAKVRLRSARYDGVLRVKKCEFTGDTHGGDWYTDIHGVIHGA